MLTSGDVGDQNATVDRTLQHRDCELVLQSVWNVEPVQQSSQSMVVLVSTSDRRVQHTL